MVKELIKKEFPRHTEWHNKKGQRHREDGPAREFFIGDKEWWQNGKRHRIDGPAIEYYNGDKEWYQNGKRHRIDGPAVEIPGRARCWYYEGNRIQCNSQEEFKRLIKLKAFW